MNTFFSTDDYWIILGKLSNFTNFANISICKKNVVSSCDEFIRKIVERSDFNSAAIDDNLYERSSIDNWTTTLIDKIIFFNVRPEMLDSLVTLMLKCYKNVNIDAKTSSTSMNVYCKDRRGLKLVVVAESLAKKYTCTEADFLDAGKLCSKMNKQKVQVITRERQASVEEMKQNAGLFYDLTDDSPEIYDIKKRGYDPDTPDKKWLVIDRNTDIKDPDNDKILLKFRKACIPFELQKLAYVGLVRSAKFTRNANRGVAAGVADPDKVKTVRPNMEIGKIDKYRVYGKLNNGSISKSNSGNPAKSAIVGWTDVAKRTEKNVKCRLTAYTAKHMEDYQRTFPFFEAIDSVYKKEAPDEWKLQANLAKSTDTTVGNTCFSSITVNYDWRSGLHADRNDYKKGYGLFRVCQPFHTGGELLFPEYNIAVRVCSGDVLLFDSHAYHCNAPLNDRGDRLTFVCYLRDKIPTLCKK